MNLNTNTEITPGIIQLELDQQIASDSLNHTLEEVISTRESTGISRVILKQGQTASNLPVAQAFQFGVEIASKSSALVVALVAKPEVSGTMAFVETVAKNRGAQVKLFVSTREAKSWLGSQFVA